jgi:hypothetical protein
VIKTGFEPEFGIALQSSPSPPRGRGHADDADDAESVLFMEQGRQVYDTSRARSKAAAVSEVSKDAILRPATAKSGVSGATRPKSA